MTYRQAVATITLGFAMLIAGIGGAAGHHAAHEVAFHECMNEAVQQRLANIELNMKQCEAEQVTGPASWLH